MPTNTFAQRVAWRKVLKNKRKIGQDWLAKSSPPFKIKVKTFQDMSPQERAEMEKLYGSPRLR